jgi:hypothetical protein
MHPEAVLLILLIGFFDELNLFVVVYFLKFYFDDLSAAGGYVFADVGSFDGQFAMAAVDEDGELNAARTAMVKEGVECGADGAAGVENIVAENHVAAIDVKAERALSYDGTDIMRGEVVAIETNVKHACVDGAFFDSGDELGEALGEWNASALDADESETGAAIGFFDDFMGEADKGAFDFRSGHQAAFEA